MLRKFSEHTNAKSANWTRACCVVEQVYSRLLAIAHHTADYDFAAVDSQRALLIGQFVPHLLCELAGIGSGAFRVLRGANLYVERQPRVRLRCAAEQQIAADHQVHDLTGLRAPIVDEADIGDWR